jgi:hypothetical protein
VCDVLSINPLKKESDHFFLDVSIWRGTAGRDVGVRRRVSAKRQDSNEPRLARAPRGALRGLRFPVSPATFARRPVRRSPASRSAVPR